MTTIKVPILILDRYNITFTCHRSTVINYVIPSWLLPELWGWESLDIYNLQRDILRRNTKNPWLNLHQWHFRVNDM